jgi:hypothetical protein
MFFAETDLSAANLLVVIIQHVNVVKKLMTGYFVQVMVVDVVVINVMSNTELGQELCS